MDFTEATDALTRCPTLEDVATGAGVSHAKVRQARMDPSSPSHRAPPEGWEAVVAKLARERARELVELAEGLEG